MKNVERIENLLLVIVNQLQVLIAAESSKNPLLAETAEEMKAVVEMAEDKVISLRGKS